MLVFLAGRDYVHAFRYAFTRPWKDKDSALHSHAIASVFGLFGGGLLGFRVVVDHDRLGNLVWGALFLALGLAEGAYIVRQYRRRDEPEPDHIEKINRVIDRIFGARNRRKAKQT